jgi:hypothetical protein
VRSEKDLPTLPSERTIPHRKIAGSGDEEKAMNAIIDRTANEEKLNAALARVAAIDLDRIRNKVQNKRGWTEERAARAVELYRRYLALLVLDRNQKLAPPSPDADEIWHGHILDTRAYHRDCESLFGTYLHHVPSYGTAAEKVQMAACRERTELVFQTHFGTPAEKAAAVICAGCGTCYAQPTSKADEETALCVCMTATVPQKPEIARIA